MKHCPKCRTEYRDGFDTCADCNLHLVDNDLPEEKAKEYVRFKELLFTYSSGDIAFLKSLLDARNIRYHIQGEIFMQVRPLVQPVGVMVDEKQYEEAKELLKNFKGRFTGLAPRGDEESKGAV